MPKARRPAGRATAATTTTTTTTAAAAAARPAASKKPVAKPSLAKQPVANASVVEPLIARLIVEPVAEPAAKPAAPSNVEPVSEPAAEPVAEPAAEARKRAGAQSAARKARREYYAVRAAKFKRAKREGLVFNSSAVRKILLMFGVKRANKAALYALTTYASKLYRDLVRREIEYVLYRRVSTLTVADAYRAINDTQTTVYK